MLVTGEIVAAINALQRFIVCRLQAQLEPNLITLFKVARQQIKRGGRHAVRPRANADPDHIGLLQRLPIHVRQQAHFCISTGIGLKVGQVAFCAVDPAGLHPQLFGNALALHLFVGKRGYVAEGTTAAAQGTVTIWAAKTAVQREFMDLFAVPTLEIGAKHID